MPIMGMFPQSGGTDKQPTQGSENAVQSGGVYDALSKKQDTLTGSQGQAVGFDGNGKAVAVEVGSVNLFANATSVPGYLSDANDGNISGPSAEGKERTSDYISVVAGENITVQTWATSTATSGNLHYMIDYMWFTDKAPGSHINNKTRVSGGSTGFNHAIIVTAKAPANAKYVRVSARLYSDGKMKIERGSVATDWSPAPEDVDKRIEDLAAKTAEFLPNRYVARWDKIQNTCTRMYDAANITTDITHFAYRGSVDPAYNNPFDNIYPWSHRKVCKVDKEKYQELYKSGGDIMKSITLWEGDPGFHIGPDAPGMDMVYSPEYWYRQWSDGTYVYWGIADKAIDGWKHSPERLLARYLASLDPTDQKLTSLAGDVPYVDTISIAQLHKLANDMDMTIDTVEAWCAETCLMVVEAANVNVQQAWGEGVSSLYRAFSEHPKEAGNSVNTVNLPSAMKSFCIPGAILAFGAANDRGTVARRPVVSVADVDASTIKVTFGGDPVTYTTAHFVSIHGLYNSPDEEIGSKSGWIGTTQNRSTAYYRGRNCWGNCYHYLLGLYREQNTNHIWAAPTEEIADSLDQLDKAQCVDTGCVLPVVNGAQGEGYIKELYLNDDYPCAPLCKAIGGDSTKPVGDYCWWPASTAGNTICLAGASAAAGLLVGRFAAYWHRASSVAWWNYAVSLSSKNPKGGV